MRSVKGKYGDVWYYGKDEYVGRSFHNYGEFSGEECEKILELSGNGLCLDIGANIGAIAQMLAFHGRKVVAFEPQPEIFKLLVKNFPGDAYCCALGKEEGVVGMPRVRYGDKGNYGGMACGTRSELGSIQVPVKTLDSFGFNNVSFIKIDVEGYEKLVLEGAVETIARNKPIMYIEDDRMEKREALRAFLTKIGYKYELHVTPLFRENNFFGNKKNIWDKNYVSYNLICEPC